MEPTQPTWPSTYRKPTFSQEIRLGLIAYNGISLAIYMSGICQEFYQAVRGRGVYKLLKALVDSDIVVDVVSGTSAGGINGVILSYALTNSTATETVDFNAFNEVCRNNGDIYQRLHQQATSSQPLMDGDGYYQQQLEAAFVNAFQHRVPPPEQEWVSPLRELDLLVTSTDFWGKVYRTFNANGSVTEAKDHRGVFHLKHRYGRKEPFNPFSPGIPSAKPQHTFQALAKLCRLTSALPMVFPMVRVDLNDPQNLVDRYLAKWGNLDRRQWQHRPEGKSIGFLDGGFLHNAPFAPAIREMYYRTPDRLVQRTMFYVDPNPPKSDRLFRKRFANQSNLLQFLPGTMPELPMYQSVATNLRYIQEHNQKVYRYQALVAHAENSINVLPHHPEFQLQKNIYLRSRLINLRSQAISALLRLKEGGDAQRRTELDRLSQLLIHPQVSSADKNQREQCIQDFAPQMAQLDVDYSLRQHFYLVDKIHEQLQINQSPEDQFYLEALAQQVGQSIQLIEVLKAGLQKLFSHPVISDNFYAMLGVHQSNLFLRPLIYEYIFRLHRYLLDVQALPLLMPKVEELPPAMDAMVELSNFFICLPLTANETQEPWLPATHISAVWQQLQEKIGILANAAQEGQYLWNKHRFHYDQRENQRFLSMLTQIESATTLLLHNSPIAAARSLLHQFQRFEHLDPVLYPVEYLTDLGEKESIKTVRISPANAQMGLGKDLRDKLSGDLFYTVGGFFQKSWQTNDILWGRLDGLNRIMEGIINPESVKNFSNFVQRESSRLAMTPAVYLKYLLQESLPNLTDPVRQTLQAHLTYLAQPDLHISIEKLRHILNDIVLAGQNQILEKDLDRVFQEANAQNQTWRSTSYALTQTPLTSSSMQLVHQITQDSLNHLLAEQRHFFRNQYKVGSENLFANVSGMVWVNWATHSVLVLRDILLNAGGSRRATKLRKQFWYRFLDQELQGWYWWLQLRGTRIVLKLTSQRLQVIGQVVVAIVVTGSVLFTDIKPLWWLGLGLFSWASWGLAQQQQQKRRRPNAPKFQHLLAARSSGPR